MNSLDNALSRIKGALDHVYESLPSESAITESQQPRSQPPTPVPPPRTSKPEIPKPSRWLLSASHSEDRVSNPFSLDVEEYVTKRPLPAPPSRVAGVVVPKVCVARGPLTKRQYGLSKSPPNGVRWDILTWDPPVEGMSKRDFSLNEVLFRRPGYSKGKSRPRVNLPRSVNSRGSGKGPPTGAFGRPRGGDVTINVSPPLVPRDEIKTPRSPRATSQQLPTGDSGTIGRQEAQRRMFVGELPTFYRTKVGTPGVGVTSAVSFTVSSELDDGSQPESREETKPSLASVWLPATRLLEGDVDSLVPAPARSKTDSKGSDASARNRATPMTPDDALELSLEQLISALDKKLRECTRMRSIMPPTSRTFVAAFTAEVDTLEKRAKEVLRQVHSLRNSIQPVNRLPPGVLASCATFVSGADPRPIVPLTHVCQYWRESIGSNPENWKSIGMGWKRLVPLCLGRVGPVPLVVDIAVPDGKGDEALFDTLLPHVPRIGSLRLTGYSSIETVAEDLPGLFASPMLGLTSLELEQTAEPAQLFPSDNTPVPPPFLDVSKLRSLSLTRTPLYPPLFAVTSLVELKLIGYTTPFHFGTFLGLLDSNPGLELVMLDIQFARRLADTKPTRKVFLPRLQHLSITCSDPIYSKGLLSSIFLPRGVHLEVVSTQSDRSAQLGSFLPSPPTPIHDLLAPTTTIKTQVTPWEFRLFGNGSTFTFRSSHPLLAMHPELKLFPSTTIREFYTNIHPFKYPDAGVSETLELLPALETLVFSKTAFPLGLLSALTEEPVLCPALKTLAFFDCGINSDIMKKLGEAIAMRRGSPAARLHRVVIVDSAGISPDLALVQQLRKSVPCVEVRNDDKLPDLSKCA